ncbi:MAG: DUF4169 family protein [Amphiplicatus sp.]
MSGVVNLNRFKKRRKAAEKDAKAAENRTKFGRTKAEKARDKAAREALVRHLDGHAKEDEA